MGGPEIWWDAAWNILAVEFCLGLIFTFNNIIITFKTHFALKIRQMSFYNMNYHDDIKVWAFQT